MMSHKIVHTLHRQTFLVDRFRNQWRAYLASPGLLSFALTDMIDQGLDRLALIFQDEVAIELFLADTNPRFTTLQTFVRITRGYRNVVVMTADELVCYAALDGDLFARQDGEWKTTLTELDIKFPERHYSFRLLQLCEPYGTWSWNRTVSTPQFNFPYQQVLQFGDSLIGAVLRETTALPATSGMFCLANLPIPDIDGEPTDGGMLVVPEETRRPMLYIRAGGKLADGDAFSAESYPATIYELSRPLLIEGAGGGKGPATRRLPVDVIAAGVASA